MAIDTAIETNIYIYYYMSLTLIIINQTFKSKRTLQLGDVALRMFLYFQRNSCYVKRAHF